MEQITIPLYKMAEIIAATTLQERMLLWDAWMGEEE
jgi:hypothetical protein